MTIGRVASTAADPSASALAYLSLLFDRLPKGVVLNVGAGSTATQSGARRSVNLDIERPAGASVADFVVGDAAALPFASEVFNGALLKDVLEHVPDVVGVLREARRVVEPGGTLVAVTPRAIPRAVWDDPTHIRGFTARALHTAVGRAGWQMTKPLGRIGSVPGIGRLGLEKQLDSIMRIPGIGRWFGTNWLVEACKA
jgi:SAM-dependent methyltransferase